MAEGINPGEVINSADPKTFNEAVELVTGLMSDIAKDRQREYGPENILAIGIQGCLSRATKDKLSRIRNQVVDVELGKDGEVKLTFKPEALESPLFWDAFVDAGNYITVLPIMLLKGWLTLPLKEPL